MDRNNPWALNNVEELKIPLCKLKISKTNFTLNYNLIPCSLSYVGSKNDYLPKYLFIICLCC